MRKTATPAMGEATRAPTLSTSGGRPLVGVDDVLLILREQAMANLEAVPAHAEERNMRVEVRDQVGLGGVELQQLLRFLDLRRVLGEDDLSLGVREHALGDRDLLGVGRS